MGRSITELQTPFACRRQRSRRLIQPKPTASRSGDDTDDVTLAGKLHASERKLISLPYRYGSEP